MKNKNNSLDFIGDSLPIIGTIVSIIGIVFSVVAYFDISKELAISATTTLIAFFTGFFGKYITESFAKLQKTKRVFFSYPHKYQGEIGQIATVLRKRGVKVWLDSERIKPGSEIEYIVKEGLRDADTFVIFLGPEISPNVMYEFGLAKSMHKRIIPVLLEQSEIPIDIRNIAYVDMRMDKEKAIEELIEATT